MNLNPLLGAAQLAVGRGEGVRLFDGTVAGFLSSLAPLVAFPLVGGTVLLLGGGGWLAVAAMLQMLVAQLAPAVLSHGVAVRLDREDEWWRYATAFNWCQWALPVVAFGLALGLEPLVERGMPEATAGAVLLGLLMLYGLWLNWLIARHGLVLSAGRALAAVLLVNLLTAVVFAVPLLVGRLWAGA